MSERGITITMRLGHCFGCRKRLVSSIDEYEDKEIGDKHDELKEGGGDRDLGPDLYKD